MPELPEVETTRLGISPHISQKSVQQIIVRQRQLRWPIPDKLEATLTGLTIIQVKRRAKYLLLETCQDWVLMIHLGMSGNLRILRESEAAGKHDHLDIIFHDDTILRYNDVRKFGSVLLIKPPLFDHPLIKHLGPEPLSDAFNGQYLYEKAQNRKTAIKNLIMNSHVVVGVGNIYASEALFQAGIHPKKQVNHISLQNYMDLAKAIQNVLQNAITQGGTTLKDFVNEQGKPGYFQQSLSVYGRKGLACFQCKQPIENEKIGQRASYFCANCQR